MGCEQCICNKNPRYTWEILNPSPKAVMVIGESPTVQEVRHGNKMVGSGAAVLRETMEKVGLPFSDNEVYFTTAIKCAVPKGNNRKIPKEAYAQCHEFLLKEIAIVQPRLLLVCGATAYYTLLNSTNVKISEEYGRVRTFDNIPNCQVVPIMNPGVLLHKPGDYKPFLASLQLAATIFHGGSTVDTGETTWTVCDTKESCFILWKNLWAEYNRLKDLNETFYVSYDIETTGLDYRIVDFLVLGICFERGHAYVVPREMMATLHNFLENVPWRCIWQGGKYDKKVMWRRKLATISIDEDTMYQHYVLDETSEHNLGYLSKVYLNAEEYKYKMNQNWSAVSLDTYPHFFDALCERVAVDTDYTRQLFFKFQDIHKTEPVLADLYQNLLIPAANFLSRVEQNGMLIDPLFLNVMDKQYQVLLKKINQEIADLAAPWWDSELYARQSGAKSIPKTFKASSPQQMAWLVFDRMKLNPRIKKKRSTAKEVLKSIQDPPELITKVLEYRKVQKEHSTYVLGLLNAQDEDGRVRTTFNLHVTHTGRLSSQEPNVQNQPSANGVGKIRKAFIPSEGHVLAEIDYAGAELRWLAVLSGDEALTEIFKSGRNLHVETAKNLFGEHFTKAQKLRAKAVNFGIPYGREAKSIADEHNMPLAEAEQMMEDWFTLYHGARDYLQWCDSQVVQGNYLVSPFGRRRRFGLVSSSSLKSLQNEARNFPIQSASSDTMLCAAMECEERLRDEWKVRIINLIHDSMLLEIPADPEIIRQVGTYCNEVMTTLPKRKFGIELPFQADYEIGKNWGEVVTFDTSVEARVEDRQIAWEDKTTGQDMTTSWTAWYNGGK